MDASKELDGGVWIEIFVGDPTLSPKANLRPWDVDQLKVAAVHAIQTDVPGVWLHRAYTGPGYSLTHLACGHAILSNYDRDDLELFARALDVASGELGVDWTIRPWEVADDGSHFLGEMMDLFMASRRLALQIAQGGGV